MHLPDPYRSLRYEGETASAGFRLPSYVPDKTRAEDARGQRGCDLTPRGLTHVSEVAYVASAFGSCRVRADMADHVYRSRYTGNGQPPQSWPPLLRAIDGYDGHDSHTTHTCHVMQALDFLFGDRGLLPLTPRDSPRIHQGGAPRSHTRTTASGPPPLSPRDSPRPQRHQETPPYQTPRDSPRPKRHQETPLYQTPRASPRIQTPNRNTVTHPLDLPDGMLRDHALTWA